MLTKIGDKIPKEPAPRTSLTHPLQIAVAAGGRFRGALGVTFAPGKRDSTSLPAPWLRDLSKDLDAVVAWNARVVVTLIEPHEFELPGIPTIGEEVRQRGMDWLHLPIRDVRIPDGRSEVSWSMYSAALRARLRTGDNVLFHCRGGLGRPGMIAARPLVEEGVDPETAIAAVRAARPGAIETQAQEGWVRMGAARGRRRISQHSPTSWLSSTPFSLT